MPLPRDTSLKTFARELRKNATQEERRLWYDFLKVYPRPWKRQEIIGPYIVDFYCDSAGLVIELDGGQHYEESAKRYDEKRSGYLRSLKLEVLRFTNVEVKRNFPGVCQAIDEAIKSRTQCHDG